MGGKILGLALAVALVGLSLPSARADDSDIFGANIQPNVLLAIDNSGSMGDSIYADPYDPAETYAASSTCDPPCVSTTVYRRTSSDYSVYATSISDVSSTSAQTALSTVGYWSGRIGGSRVNLFLGNYLNWLVTPGATLTKKIDIAKRVLTRLVNNVEGVRFGLMTFTANGTMGSGGGKILAPIGSSTSTITTAISGLYPYGYTPLGEMLRDAGKYYKGLGDYGGAYKTSPIQLECQPNFVILMSDGLQNGTVDVRTEATLRYTQDHADTLAGIQNVIVHTAGFAISAGEKAAANDVLQTAATNGGGTFYDTDSETQLEAALEDAIRQIMAATFTFATPVIPTTSTTGSSKAYLAAFKSDPSRPFWRGYLAAYQRDSDGNVPVDSNGVPCGNPNIASLGPGCVASALVWEAGQQLSLKAASTRTIYTMVGTSRVDFRTSTAEITAAMLGVASTERDKLIDFIRGVDTYDENVNGNTTEERAWKLGDIFHATPALVTPPIAPSTDSSYDAFKTANHNRTTILLAGADDGMLHAFQERDGEELWAFIPPDILGTPALPGTLSLLTVSGGEHPFFVDGSPIVADVQIGGTWKTVAIFGERRGGRFYHALDITNPGDTDSSYPKYLWSFTDSKLGETWSTPVIGKIKMADGTTKFVAFVGGGYDTAQNNNTGKAVFAIDIATGSKLWEYSYAAGDDRQYMNFSIPADMTAVDLNMDGYVDRLYIGDVAGQVWKFDLSAPATLSGGLVSNWTGKRLFTADATAANLPNNPPPVGAYYPTQAIYAAIIPAYDDQRNVWIYFGTGDRNHPNNTTAPNRFYGIKDNTTMANGGALVESSLVDVTSTNATAAQGWFFRLGADEKVLSAANVFNKIVYFTSFIPTTSVACGSGGGNANLYAIQMLTGYAAVNWTDGTALTTTSASETRSKLIGVGIASRPILILTESGARVTASVIACTTSQQCPTNPAVPPSGMRKVLYWREVFF